MIEEGSPTGRKLGPTGDAPTYPLSGVSVSAPVREALRLASREAPRERPLSTGCLLAALERVDLHGRWDRVWIRTSRNDSSSLAGLPDPDEVPRLLAPPSAKWGDVPLSPALAASLALLREMVEEYDMVWVQPGALALALVSEPTAAVVTTLLDGGDFTHSDLLEIVQNELLGTELPGFDSLVARRWRLQDSRSENPVQRAKRVARAENRQADDLDLLQVLVAELGDQNLVSIRMIANVATEAAAPARTLGTRPLDEVVEIARERVGGEPDGWQLLVAAVERPTRGCAAVLEVAGLTGPGVAVDVLVAVDERAGRRVPVSRALAGWELFHFIFLLTAPALVIAHVVGPGSWWELLLIPLTLLGPPLTPVLIPVLVAVALYFLVTPVSATAQLGVAVMGWLRYSAERRRLWSQTGIRLRPGEYVGHRQRRRGTPTTLLLVSSKFGAVSRQDKLERRAAKLGSARAVDDDTTAR